MESMQSVTVIIVNFNTEAHVMESIALLASRPEELPSQIVVVDNSPANNLASLLKQLDIDIEYIPTERNLGFAGGVNSGIEVSSGRVIILLNPDARPEPGCLSTLVAVLKSDDTIAVAAPELLPLTPNESPAPSAIRRDPALLTTLVEYTALHRLVPSGWLNTNYFVMPGSETATLDCAMVQGACFAISRNWLERTGSFDAERFFLYWEETDYCRRARERGGRVVYCPQTQCLHLGGASMPDSRQDIHHFWQSLYNYHHKHSGLLKTILLRLLLIPGIAAELIILGLLSFRMVEENTVKQDMARMLSILKIQFHSVKQQDRIVP